MAGTIANTPSTEPAVPVGTGSRVVAPGECLASIAAAEGYFWETLWEHPENAALKKARGNPYTLLPGDRVFLPEKSAGSRPIATGRRHVFRRRGVPEKLRLQFSDEDGAPRAGLAYTIEIDGVVVTGTTGDDGLIDQWIPPVAKDGTLTIGEDEVLPLGIGHLDPVSSESGARARLANLEYLDGAEPDSGGELYALALLTYQRIHGLEANGKLDAPTQAALLEEHGY
jgi:hypothetical protein